MILFCGVADFGFTGRLRLRFLVVELISTNLLHGAIASFLRNMVGDHVKKESIETSLPGDHVKNEPTETSLPGDHVKIPIPEDFNDTTFGLQFFQSAKHIDFLEIAEDGCAILGKSNLNSRYWTGSVWYYMNVDDVPRQDKYLTGFDCKAGVSDGKIISDVLQSVVIGKDTGELTILCMTESVKEHEFLFRPEVTAMEHDDTVLSLAVSSDKSVVVSASSDCSIIKWKTNQLELEHHYKFAHTQAVTSVATSIDDSNDICVSSSLDGSAVLWDFRQEKPASVILDDSACGLTSVAWRNSNEVICGTSWGSLKFIDIRNKLITSHPCFNRAIHRILPSNDRRLMAVGGDTHILKVFDLSSSNILCVYEDSKHTDFIHALAWHPKTQNLYSAGWDSQVFRHSIGE